MMSLRPGRLYMTTLAAAFFMISTFHLSAPHLDSLWVSRALKADVTRVAACPEPVVAITGFSEPSTVFMLGTETMLGSPEDAATALRDHDCAVAVVDRREGAAFGTALQGLTVRARGTIDGMNYSKGRVQELTLFTRAD